MRGFITLSLSACAAAAPSFFSHETIHSDAAPILSSVNAETIPDQYIIKFKDHVSEASALKHHSWVQQMHTSREGERLELRKRGQIPIIEDVFSGLKHTYTIGSGFLGYAGHFDDATIEEVRRHPDVEYIERDSIVYTMRVKEEEKKDTDCIGETQKIAPWGLARISHRNHLTFGTFNKYLYAENGGEGVDAYIIDTGINHEHVDFEGRAHWGKTIPKGDPDSDDNGHGSHCAGTTAGKNFGVAKKAHVYAVKVLRSNGSGTMSDVIAGIQWAADSHNEQVKAAKAGKRKGFKGSVANMSLGGGKTTLLDAAVNAAVDAGIHFAVAAGNDNADACSYSPAAATKAITVGATGLDDSRAYFSNYGKCTDIFAPGLNIESIWIGGNDATNIISGTSMASPHICGLLAYYLSLQPSTDSEYSVAPITPEQLKSNLISVATVGSLDDMPKNTPNLLAWNGGGCSNYSAILEAGSFQVERENEKESMALPMYDFEEAFDDEFDVVSNEVSKGLSSLTAKAEELSERLHELVDEELSNFLAELH